MTFQTPTAPSSPVRGYDRVTGLTVEQLAWADGVHDDGPLLQDMLNKCGTIFPAAGCFDTSITLTPPDHVEGAGIIGLSGGIVGVSDYESRGTIIRGTAPDMTVIKSPAYCTGPTFMNLVIDRKVPATAGYGLDMGISCDHANVSNLFIDNQMVGIYLGTTGFSKAEYIHVQRSKQNGFNVVGQWQLGRCLATLNGGIGFAVTNYTAPEGNSLGQWTGLSTYANLGHGIGFFGPVYDIRLSDSFFGADGGFEIYLAQDNNDTNVFTNVVLEDCRQSFGIYIGPGCGFNSFVNCSVLGGVSHGVLSLAPKLSWIGGQIASFSKGYGLLAQAGKISVQGANIDRNAWGVGATAGVTDISVLGCFLSGNTIPLDVALAGHSTAYGNL